MEKWQEARWPLLLILIDLKESKMFRFGKDFKHIQMSVFEDCKQRQLRKMPAYPWKVDGTRWFGLQAIHDK